jgi:hypothetical protein
VASALRGMRTGEGRWQARCLSHDDKNPSLSTGTSRSGKVLLHCFAGCDPNDIIDTLERNHGLPLRVGKGAAKPRQAARGAKKSCGVAPPYAPSAGAAFRLLRWLEQPS